MGVFGALDEEEEEEEEEEDIEEGTQEEEDIEEGAPEEEEEEEEEGRLTGKPVFCSAVGGRYGGIVGVGVSLFLRRGVGFSR